MYQTATPAIGSARDARPDLTTSAKTRPRAPRGQLLGLLAATSAVAAALAWQAAAPAVAADNPMVCYVDATFFSGADSLRSNSTLNVWLQTSRGWVSMRDDSGRVNIPGGSQAYTQRTIRLTPSGCVNQNEVYGYEIRLNSNPEVWESDDNWSLDKVVIKDGVTPEWFTNQLLYKQLVGDHATQQLCSRAWVKDGSALYDSSKWLRCS